MFHIYSLFYLPVIGIDIIAIVAFFRKRNISLLGTSMFVVSLLFTVFGTLISSKGWLAASILFSIIGSIMFAAGWDKIKEYANVSKIEGVIKLPELPFVFNPIIKLENIYGRKKTFSLELDENGRFLKNDLPPTTYKLTIRGDYLVEQFRMVEIHPKSSENVGVIKMKFHFPYIIALKNTPKIYIKSLIRVHKKFWIMGHEYISNKHKPKLYKYEDNHWIEKTVDPLLGSISMINSTLTDEMFIVGSSGKGAAFSLDGGETWERLTLPNGVWYLDQGMQIQDGSWWFVADNGLPIEGNSNIILRTRDFEKWDIIFKPEARILSFIQHSSGIIVVSTHAGTGLDNAQVYYSDTNGETWKKAKLPNNSKYKAINGLFELQDGFLLAGTRRGGEKENYVQEVYLLASEDGGCTWKQYMNVPNVGEVTGIFESPSKDIILFGDQLLIAPFGTKEVYTLFQSRVDFLRAIDSVLYFNNFQNIYTINIKDLEIKLKRTR